MEASLKTAFASGSTRVFLPRLMASFTSLSISLLSISLLSAARERHCPPYRALRRGEDREAEAPEKAETLSRVLAPRRAYDHGLAREYGLFRKHLRQVVRKRGRPPERGDYSDIARVAR